MSIASAIVFILTLVYALTGDNPFDGAVTAVLLGIFGVLTVVCLCISNAGGNAIYKIGFYVIHGGLVLLVIGFMIYGLFGEKYDVGVFRGETYYDSIRDTSGETEKMVELGFGFRLEEVYTEYHLDRDGVPTKDPKMYYAVLSVVENGSSVPKTFEISVNKPLRLNGYKIYLMAISNDGQSGATFLFKKDPAELTITLGMASTIIGAFLMCYSSGFVLKKKAGDKNE